MKLHYFDVNIEKRKTQRGGKSDGMKTSLIRILKSLGL